MHSTQTPVGAAFASTVLPWVDETTTFPGAAPVVMMIRIGILWPHEVLVEQGKNGCHGFMLFSSWWLNQPI